MIDLSIGLGTGKILAVVAVDAQHHALAPGAIALDRVKCLGVAVAESWTGETIADLLRGNVVPLLSTSWQPPPPLGLEHLGVSLSSDAIEVMRRPLPCIKPPLL